MLGSGSNLLVADEGVPGLVLKLDRELAAISIEGRAPALRRRRAAAGGGGAGGAREGLSGIEFGVNIPGTVGGAVRMNANAYGGELARVLEWVEIAGPDGVLERRRPQELGFAYRSSALARGRGRGARLAAARSRPRSRQVKAHARGDAPPPSRGPAAGDQDVRLDLQEPRGPRRGAGTHRGDAARRGRLLPGWRSGARASPPSTRTSSRTPARRATADVSR